MESLFPSITELASLVPRKNACFTWKSSSTSSAGHFQALLSETTCFEAECYYGCRSYRSSSFTLKTPTKSSFFASTNGHFFTQCDQDTLHLRKKEGDRDGKLEKRVASPEPLACTVLFIFLPAVCTLLVTLHFHYCVKCKRKSNLLGIVGSMHLALCFHEHEKINTKQ